MGTVHRLREESDGPLPCAGKTTLFYEERNRDSVARAKELCGTCPAIAPCLASALAGDERDGIWGGTTPDERRVILGRKSRAS